MAPRSEVIVDLDALDHNLATIRGMLAPGTSLGCVVKADAYGLGAPPIARRMARHVDMLVVFGLDEAEAVHAAAPGVPQLVLMPVRSIEAGSRCHGMLRRGLLHCAAHDLGQVEALAAQATQLDVRVPLHVEVDTGLGRGGARPPEATAMVQAILRSGSLDLAGVFTHFASSGGSETATDAQRVIFESWVRAQPLPPACLVHSASTFAAIRHERFHHRMVRLGLAWTGLAFEGTRDGRFLAQTRQLRPVVRWMSHVMLAQRLPTGAMVGYGSRWVARGPSVVGLVPAGYADGYPLLPMDPARLRPAHGERRQVRVRVGEGPASRWEAVPVVGAVSMDQIAVDLTAVAPQLPGQGLNAEVELISSDPAAPNHAVRSAAMVGQHAYALLCGISARVPRRYESQCESVTVSGREQTLERATS
ncbi:MAG: alanine racemase [Phycisphaerales bacterium]|jgi:alanine racemase